MPRDGSTVFDRGAPQSPRSLTQARRVHAHI
jgi:hypothetical protein